MPGVGGKDPGAASMGMSEKDIFEDTDFSLEVNALDSDHDDRTVQIDRSSDFDLEESDSASEVFALDEDDVDQNAATAMGRCRHRRGGVGRVRATRLGRDVVASGGRRERGARPPRRRVRPGRFDGDGPGPLLPDRPRDAGAGCSYALDVWAYIEAQRAEVMARARESQGTDDIRVKTKDGVVIARGVVLTVRLAIPTLEVADPEDVIDWDGEIGNATFPVSVPAEARPGPHAGTATFHVDQLRSPSSISSWRSAGGLRPWHPWPPARSGASAPSPRTRARTATRSWGGSRAS